jgi:hypothetical protein
VEAFEAANLPLLFDEVDKRILWPGSREYDEWAATSPQEAAEDEEVRGGGRRQQAVVFVACSVHAVAQFPVMAWKKGGRRMWQKAGGLPGAGSGKAVCCIFCTAGKQVGGRR